MPSCSLYRISSGKYPIEASSLTELAGKYVRREIKPPLRDARPDLPGNFVQGVGRALAAVAAERPERVAGTHGACPRGRPFGQLRGIIRKTRGGLRGIGGTPKSDPDAAAAPAG